MVLLRQLALDIKNEMNGEVLVIVINNRDNDPDSASSSPRARHEEPAAGGRRCQDHPEKLGI